MLNAPFFLVILYRLYDVNVTMASFAEILAPGKSPGSCLYCPGKYAILHVTKLTEETE